MMHTTYRQVKKFSTGDPDILCRSHHSEGKSYGSALDKYVPFIIEQLKLETEVKHIYETLLKMGHTGKRSNFYDYCKKVVGKYDIDHYTDKNINGVKLLKEKIKCRYIERNNLLKYLWSSKGITDDEYSYITRKYPLLKEIEECIVEFRKIFKEKCTSLLHRFIDKYIKSGIKNLKSFANGITKDLVAVENAVTSEYSNGFLEGNNSRLKMIKRTMYGRASLPLLRAKIVV